MTIEKALTIIENEKLEKPLIKCKPINLLNRFGYYYDKEWILYETDDRGCEYLTESYDSEEECIDNLIEWLRRSRRMKEYRLNKINFK